jgi:hypothetical protein
MSFVFCLGGWLINCHILSCHTVPADLEHIQHVCRTIGPQWSRTSMRPGPTAPVSSPAAPRRSCVAWQCAASRWEGGDKLPAYQGSCRTDARQGSRDPAGDACNPAPQRCPVEFLLMHLWRAKEQLRCWLVHRHMSLVHRSWQ